MSGKRQAAERAGRRGEALAEIMLRLKGYRILQRRYTSGAGEIDLIARRGNIIVFAEVKHRASLDAALHSVTPFQAKRIMDAADIFMAKHIYPRETIIPPEMRFDIVVTGSSLWPRHITDAFRDHYGG